MDAPTAVCLECGYPVSELQSSVCPECGCAFDLADPSTFQRVLADPVLLIRCQITEGAQRALMLEAAGIPVSVHHEAGGIIMYAPIPQSSLWVNRDELDRARQIIKAKPAETGATPVNSQPWLCPKCNEENASNFEICWNCGSSAHLEPEMDE